jgi:hypothetical protein
VFHFFIVRRKVIQSAQRPSTIIGKVLDELSGIGEPHQRYFVLRSQPVERNRRGPTDPLTEGVKTTGSVDQEDYRQRQRVPTETLDLLPDTIFIEHKIGLGQIADRPAGALLKYQRVHYHKIDIEVFGAAIIVRGILTSEARPV